MGWIRPQLARVAGGWLVLHLCLAVSVPAALCSMTPAHHAGPVECTCGHGDGGMCAMHHGRGHSSVTPDPHSCSCRAASDPAAALAASLVGPAAVLAPNASLIAPASPNGSADPFKPQPVETPAVPDSPPPRR